MDQKTPTLAKDEVIVTSHAMDLLGDLESELGEIAFEMAEDLARRRQGRQESGQLVEITAPDVRSAAARVLKALSEMAAGDHSSRNVTDRIHLLGQSLQRDER